MAEENSNTVDICFAFIKDKNGMGGKTIVYIDDICIDKNYRGQSLGKKLFANILEKAKEIGAKGLDLMVWSFNKKALNFYKELGIKPQRYIFEKEL